MGVAKGSDWSPRLAARPQSIRLSSAPESMSTWRLVVVALCVILTAVSMRRVLSEIRGSLTGLGLLVGQVAMR